MKKDIKVEETIVDLLSSKNYSTLSEAEKESISSCIEKHEYEELHKLQDKVKKILCDERKNVSPDYAVFAYLIQQMNKHEQNNHAAFSWLRFLQYKLPVYQAIAASLCIVTGIYFILSNSNTIETTRVVYKNIIDTVYLSSSVAFIDSDILLQDSGFSHLKTMDKMLNIQTMVTDRFIPEIQQIRMMDIAHKSLSLRN